MMKEHCMIDGNRCSKCCEVLTIRDSKNFREWRAHVRRYGADSPSSDIEKVSRIVRKISRRRAKLKNPGLVGGVKNQQAYFTCKNYQNGACADYAGRPYMCSGYPYYRKEKADFLADPRNLIGLYRPDCTYFEAE